MQKKLFDMGSSVELMGCRQEFSVGAIISCLLLLTGCGSDSLEDILHDNLVTSSGFTLNPTGSTPLAAELKIETRSATKVIIIIDDGTDSLKIIFPESATEHTLPVLGLKPNMAYTVSASVIDLRGHEISLDRKFDIATSPLPDDFPLIEVHVSKPDLMESGYILLDRFGRGRPANADFNLTRYSSIFDSRGDVVWFSTLGGVAMRQLENGSLFYGLASNSFDEIDMLGNLINSVPHDFDVLHHDALPTPHGTVLSLSRELREVEGYPTSYTDTDAPTQTLTVEVNPVVEIDANGMLVNKWVPNDMLDPTRIGYGALEFDWAHSNAVFYDERDDSILVSVRHQDAVIKFSRETGELIWILGPHENWTSEFEPYLLTPVGAPFEWQYHQHAPMITQSGTLMLFDNGNYRASPFDGAIPMTTEDSYSRAVEFEIDETNMEVRQVWEFGANSSPRLYANFISDADSMPVTRNTLINFGGLRAIDGTLIADLNLGDIATRVIEVTHASPGSVVFDMTLYNPTPTAWINTYRAEKIRSLYPPDVVVTTMQ